MWNFKNMMGDDDIHMAGVQNAVSPHLQATDHDRRRSPPVARRVLALKVGIYLSGEGFEVSNLL
jgi:hypothetical protein